MFGDLEAIVLDQCVASFGELKFFVGDEVCRQGEEGENFYVVKSGKLGQT